MTTKLKTYAAFAWRPEDYDQGKEPLIWREAEPSGGYKGTVDAHMTFWRCYKICESFMQIWPDCVTEIQPVLQHEDPEESR